MTADVTVPLNPIVIDTIATHFRPDIDDKVCIFLLWEMPEAEQMFPGVNNALIRAWNAGRKTPDGSYATWEWITRNGIFPVGCAASPCDEHAVPELSRRRREGCAATLLAEIIGVTNHVRLRSILAYAAESNNKATAKVGELAWVLKRMYDNEHPRMDERLYQEVIFWTLDGIAAKYQEDPGSDRINDFSIEHIALLMREQGVRDADVWLDKGRKAIEKHNWLFQHVTGPEYRAKRRIIEYQGYRAGKKFKKGGKPILTPLKIALVSMCDDPRIHQYARSESGDQVAVTIQVRSTGNVQIMINQRYNIQIKPIARAIMCEEARIRGVQPPYWDDAIREMDFLDWYFHVREDGKGVQLLNGSLTAPFVPPTRIPSDRIAEIVRVVLSVEEYEPSRSAQCTKGSCTSTRENSCSWYYLGLPRCRHIRYEEVMSGSVNPVGDRYLPPELVDEEN